MARGAAAQPAAAGPRPSPEQALAPLAPLDAQQHALGIDIASAEARTARLSWIAARPGYGRETAGPDPERVNFRDAQPARYAVANAASYFGPGAAWSSSVTSSALSTAGNRRGCGTTVSRRARSARSSYTVKKKRRAEIALLMRGGCVPTLRIPVIVIGHSGRR